MPTRVARNDELAPLAYGTPQGYPTAGGGEDDEGPQINIAALLWRRRWIILSCLVLGLAGGYGVYRNSPPVYQSTAQLLVRPGSGSVLGDAGLNEFGGNNFLATQVRIAMSREVLAAAASQPNVSSLPSLAEADSILGELYRVVRVSAGEDADVLTISATAAREEDSLEIVRAVQTGYQDFLDQRFDAKAVDSGGDLAVELATVEREIDRLHALQVQYKRDLGSLDLNGRAMSLEGIEAQQLSMDHLAAKTEARDLQLLLDAATAERDNPATLDALLPPLENGGDSSIMRGELSNMQRELRDIEYVSGPNSPRVLRLREMIADRQQELGDLETQDLNNRLSLLQRRTDAAASRAQALGEEFEQRRQAVLENNTRAAQLARIERDLSFNFDQRENLAARIAAIEVAERGGVAEPIVINPPGPGEQVEPKATQLIGMGVVLGLMAGFGLAFLREWLDPKLRTVDDVQDLLGLPVLGEVPTLARGASNAERALQMQHHPRGPASEAYRDVRTLLLAAMQQRYARAFSSAEGEDVQEPRVILVTSPMPGEGKTTLTTNLATSLARLGRRTLLIDADCRRPRQHEYLLPTADDGSATDPGPGLSGVLQEGVPEQEASRETIVDRLRLLPCGPLPSDPSELLNSEEFLQLLDDCREKYDHIVLDSPPVLPVTDARVLGAIADATVLVVRANQTTRRGAKVAAEGLLRTGSDIVGVVVNSIGKQSGSEGYGYGYEYSYAGPALAARRAARRARRVSRRRRQWNQRVSASSRRFEWA